MYKSLLVLHVTFHQLVLASTTALTVEQLHTALNTSGLALVPGHISFEGALTIPAGSNVTIRGTTERAILDGNSRTALFVVHGLLRLENVTIQGGNGTNGGAVYVSRAGRLELFECVAMLNQARYGGVVYTQYGSVLVHGGSFFNNVASADGGVVYNNHGSASFQGATLHHNTAKSKGGVVYNHNGTLHFDGSSLLNNEANTDGGVAYNIYGSVVFDGGICHDNTAESKGGVLYNHDGILHIFGGEFHQNQATFAGGVGYNVGGVSRIVGTLFSYNKAGYEGGVFTNVEHVGHAEDIIWKRNQVRNGRAQSRGGVLSNIRCADYRIVNCRAHFNTARYGDGGCFYFEGGGYHIHGGVYRLNNGKFGGVFADRGVLRGEVIDTEFESNRGETGGCAGFLESYNPSIKNALFENNNAFSGGAIAAQNLLAEIVIVGSTFWDSNAVRSGGFIYAVTQKHAQCVNIKDANFTNGISVDRGGAIFATCGVTATNSSFLSNSAGSGGNWVVFNVINSTLRGNHARIFGGAICNEHGRQLHLSGSILEDNVADLFGGALYSQLNGAVIEGPCRILNNRAITGGAVYVQPGIRLTLRNLQLIGNTALSGVIHVGSGGYLFVTDIVVENSVATEGGVLYLDSGASGKMRDSVFANNSAMTGGAAYLSESTSLACYDSMVEFNRADSGGGFASFGSVITLRGCSFYSNKAHDKGGAFSLHSSHVVSEGGCTFTSNTASFGGVAYAKSGSTFTLHEVDTGTGNNAQNGGGIVFYEHLTTERPPDPPSNVTASARFGDIYATDLAFVSATHQGDEVNNRKFDNMIIIEAFDALGQRYRAIDAAAIKLNVVPGGLIGTTVLSLIDGQAETSDIRVTHETGTIVTIVASVVGSDVETSFNVTLRACRFGEVGDDCKPCIDSGKYSVNPDEDKDCLDCPNDASCHSESANHTWPGAVVFVNSGHWRSGPLSTNIRRCPYAKSCKGGVDLWTADDSCHYHHRGPLCANCDDGYILDRASGECYECSDNKRTKRRAAVFATVSLFVFLILAFIAIPFILADQHHLLLKDFLRQRGVSWQHSWFTRAIDRLMPLVKIVFVFSQVVSSEYSTFLFVTYPPAFDAAMIGVSTAIDFAVRSAFASLCIRVDHYKELLTVTLLPLAIVAFAELVHIVGSRRATTDAMRKRIRNYTTFISLITLFIVYSNASAVICSTFRCDREFHKEPAHSFYRDKSYLAVDYSISCTATVYQFYFIYSSIMVFVYPFGVPIFFFSLLWTKRHLINCSADKLADEILGRSIQRSLSLTDVSEARTRAEPVDALKSGDEQAIYDDLRTQAVQYTQAASIYKEEDALKPLAPWLQSLRSNFVASHARHDRKIAHLSFLFCDYSSNCWWFESVECIRRLLLTAVLPVFYSVDNGAGLLYGTFLISLLFSAMYMIVHPFANDDINHFAVLMHAALSLILFLTIVLYSEERLDRADSARWKRPVIGRFLVFISTCFGPIMIIFYAKLGGLSLPFGASRSHAAVAGGQPKVDNVEVKEEETPCKHTADRKNIVMKVESFSWIYASDCDCDDSKDNCLSPSYDDNRARPHRES